MTYPIFCSKCNYQAVYEVLPLTKRLRGRYFCGRHALKYFRECMGVLAKRRLTGEKFSMPYHFNVVAEETLTPEHRKRLEEIQPNTDYKSAYKRK